MKILSILILILLFINISVITITRGCFRKKIPDVGYQIAGDELNIFLELDIFSEKHGTVSIPSDFINNPRFKEFCFYGDINIAIFIPEESLITDHNIYIKINEIFTLASNHLRAFFRDEVYDLLTVKKILICCIEYSIKWKYINFQDVDYVVNCKHILGLIKKQINLKFVAEKYDDEKVLELILHV